MLMQSQSRARPSIQQLLPTFQAFLSPQTVQHLVGVSGKRFYDRLYSPLIVVWCFLLQRLNSDHACEAIVSQIESGALDDLGRRDRPPLSQRLGSESTGPYCRARKRLPLTVLAGVLAHLAAAAEGRLGEGARWLGHRVALLDGTTLLLRPQPELVKDYGQAKNQHGLAYWVVMRVVAAFGLQTGALLAVGDGSQQQSEQSLARGVIADLAPGSVCIGDNNFGVFSIAQAARHYGVLTLLRLMPCRALALAKGKMQPDEDRRVEWSPARKVQRHPDLSQAPVSGRLIYARLERDGFRPLELYLFTTLLDASCYPAAELVALYARRWQVELDLRYVKSTLDMDLLSAKSVDMVRKELYAGVAAYNIVRICMLVAAQQAGLSPLSLSFAKCWRRVQASLCSLRPTHTPDEVVNLMRRLLSHLARCQLQKRLPLRVEPRAVRRRPAPYPALKGSRQTARQHTLQQLMAGGHKC